MGQVRVLGLRDLPREGEFKRSSSSAGLLGFKGGRREIGGSIAKILQKR